tara:strand:+ start:43 stop:600 length:558 start_codon:yes stop_codon:yes gene_type:complete
MADYADCDIKRYIVDLIEHDDKQVQELQDFVGDAADDMKRSQKQLLEHQKYYRNILLLNQSKFPAEDDYVYDYLISLYSGNPQPRPQSYDEYYLQAPPSWWIREQTTVPFLELPRREQVRLIRQYTAEERKESLDWNLKKQYKKARNVKNHQAILEKLRKKLHDLRMTRKEAIDHFMTIHRKLSD